MKDLLKRVNGIRLDSLPVDALHGMDEDLAGKQKELERRARKLEGRLMENLADKHAIVLTPIRREIRLMGESHEELQVERDRVHDATQERLLEDRMIAMLGSLKWIRALEVLVFALIVLVLGLLYYDFTNPGLPDGTRRLIWMIDTACCLVFLTEFFLRHHCADSKRWFWKRYWIDFVTSIPLPHNLEAVRLGRIARAVRLARLFRFLRVLRIILFFWRGMDKLHEVFNVRLMKKSLLIGAGVLVGGALVIYSIEGARDPNVGSFGQSVWWSVTTLITGGFGDIYNPASITCRILTILLVLAGMAVVGIFTATLTSILVGNESEAITALEKQMDARLDKIQDTLEDLSKKG